MNLLLLSNFLSSFKLNDNKHHYIQKDNQKIWKGGRLTKEIEAQWKELFIKASKGDKKSYEKFLLEIDSYLDYYCRKYLYVVLSKSFIKRI